MYQNQEVNSSQILTDRDANLPKLKQEDVTFVACTNEAGELHTVDVGEDTDIWQKQMESEGIVTAGRLLKAAAAGLPLDVHFSVSVYLDEDRKKQFCELCVIPKISLEELWEAESPLFVSQIEPDHLKEHPDLNERVFAGEWIYETAHVNVTPDFSGPLFTPWKSFRDQIFDQTKSHEDRIRYADMLAKGVTFWIEESDRDGSISAGLITPLPLVPSQIDGIAKFLQIASGGKNSADFYRNLFETALSNKVEISIKTT